MIFRIDRDIGYIKRQTQTYPTIQYMCQFRYLYLNSSKDQKQSFPKQITRSYKPRKHTNSIKFLYLSIPKSLYCILNEGGFSPSFQYKSRVQGPNTQACSYSNHSCHTEILTWLTLISYCNNIEIVGI